MSSRKSRLPEPVKSSSRSSSHHRSESKKSEKKEKEVSRSKSREKSHRDSSKDKSEKSKSKDKEKKAKDASKEHKSSSKEKSKTKDEKKSRSKRSEPSPPPPPPPKPEPEPEPEPEPYQEDEGDEYPEDFEDYDDDFEDDDDDEEKEAVVPQSSNTRSESPEVEDSETEGSTRSHPDSAKENRQSTSAVAEKPATPKLVKEVVESEKEEELESTPMLRRLQSRQGGRRLDPVRPIQQNSRVLSASERTINFRSNATTVSTVELSESDKRYRILRNLIGGLDRKTTVLLAQPPVKDYDFYLEMFGDSGRSQTYTQTGEDNMNEESQTEPEETISKWTQHPAQDDIGWGVEGGSELALGQEDSDLHLFRGAGFQSEALRKFLDVTASVMSDLLFSSGKTRDYFSMQNKSKFSFSAGYDVFQLKPTANECRTTIVTRSPKDDHSLLIGYYVSQSNHTVLLQNSLLVEYPLERGLPPQRLFTAQSLANSAIYSADGSVLFAGLKDGSIVAWDLFEPAVSFDMRLPWVDSRQGIPLREPSFDTSFMASAIHDDKAMSIVSVHAIATESGPTQLCALDECGTVSTWTVERETKPSGATGCRPGSRLVLSLASIVRPDASVLRQSPSGYVMANSLCAVPDDPLHFLIGTDVGFIASITRSKGGAYSGPRLYKSPMHANGEIFCMRFSPFDKTIVAAGLSTGSISIHKSGQAAPLVIVTPSNAARTPVMALEWSPIVPTVFYSIHHSGHILTWNLSIGKAPHAVNDLSTEKMPRVTTSFVWHDKSLAKEQAGIAYLALGLADGQAHIHALEPVKSASSLSLMTILKRMESGL